MTKILIVTLARSLFAEVFSSPWLKTTMERSLVTLRGRGRGENFSGQNAVKRYENDLSAAPNLPSFIVISVKLGVTVYQKSLLLFLELEPKKMGICLRRVDKT